MKTVKTKNNTCAKYELAITNYVMGEKIDIPQEELFNHLAKCKNCQDDLRNWRATYATMCAREYDSKPEVKQRNEAFIKGLVYGQASNKERGKVDLDNAIGDTAGKIWRFLNEHGPTSLAELPEKVKAEPYITILSTGWLKRENKVYFDQSKIPPHVGVIKENGAV
ncbi:MAG: winged helix-turn-helix domain-containing protein [Planctomycetes bacterium]|nr:winged helix-turn-helix domain-containing protein [Planctomycetota bacterium]